MITKANLFKLFHKLVEEDLIEMEDENTEYCSVSFKFKFNSVSWVLFDCEQLDFGDASKMESITAYRYERHWWCLSDEDDEKAILRGNGEECYDNFWSGESCTLALDTVKSVESYIRRVYAEAHQAVEKYRNNALIEQIKKL